MPELKNAIVMGASGGIGSALAEALRKRPDFGLVATLSRSADGFDLADEASVAAAAEKLGDKEYALIINATGILDVKGEGPEKAFKEIDADTMLRAFQVNAVGAALALKYFMPLLPRSGPCAFGTLSARVGSIGDNRLGGWISYRSSKAALNQIVHCAAIEFARTNKEATILALHPGTIKTPLTEKYAKGRYTATPEEAADNLLRVLEETPADKTGGYFDYAGEEIEW